MWRGVLIARLRYLAFKNRRREPTLEPTKNQLPATITEAEITSSDAHASLVVPALIADLGNDASWRQF
jgi:hypothetical protein